MDLSQWVSLFAVCLLGAISPGPSLAVVMSYTLRGGPRAGIASALAHGAGVALYGLLTVTGLALVVTRSPAVFALLQVLGAAYLVYLGLRMLFGSSGESSHSATTPAGSGALGSGFLVAFLNPKLAIFMLALFSQFLSPSTSVADKGIMVATVGLTDAAWYCLVTALVSHPAVLTRLENNAVVVDRVFGVALLLLGLTVLVRAILPVLG